MYLKKITVANFRNLEKADFQFSQHVTVIIGKNARGKTNLLESIYFLTNCTGFRESREEELIDLEKDQASVEGVFDNDRPLQFRIVLSKKIGSVEKIYFVNKTRKRHVQYLEDQVKSIIFSPEQIEIITGAPDGRRSYFNQLISYYDYEYKKRLGNYESAVRRRNKVLEHHRDEAALREELVFWNEYLIEQANYLVKKRNDYCTYLNDHMNLNGKKFRIDYLKNEISLERLKKFFFEEMRWRRTLIGPQKDDFQIYLKNPKEKNIQHFGSRSEQRLGIMWLKINEVRFYEENRKQKPILLLDDIFSELDIPNKKLVLDLVKQYQTVLTTTEEEIIGLTDIEKQVIRV